MKYFNTLNTGRGAVLAALILATQLFSSCSKSDTVLEQVNPEDITTLSVHVLGVADIEDMPDAILPSAHTGVTKLGTEVIGHFEQYDGFDAITSVIETPVKKNKVVLSDDQGLTKSGGLMAAAMENGIKYRLLLYSTVAGVPGETFYKSVELTSAGTTGQTVEVEKGVTYKWYSFSYNTTASIPDVDHTNPVVAAGNNDLLHASGTVIVNAAGAVNKPLGITFAHKMAQVVVEFDARGMFTDTIKALGMTFGPNLLKTANMTIKTGAMSTPTSYTPDAIDMTKFVNVETNFKDRKKAYFYTAETGTITDMKVFLQNLTIHLENGTSRVFTGLNKEFKFASVPAAVGKSYTAKIDLIESPVIATGTNLGTVKWGRANLFYKGDGQRNPYRFRIQNSGVHNNTSSDLFRYLDSKPAQSSIPIIGTILNNRDGVDPCALVYPGGVWRTPSRAEYQTLEAVTAGRTFSGSAYVEYGGVAANVEAPYPSKNLRFERNGWHQKGITGIIYYDHTGDPKEGYYWSSTANYLYHVTGTTSASWATDVKETREFPTSILPTGHNWASVRCVRTAGN